MSGNDNLIEGLVDASGTPIVSMGADWTSKAYEFGRNWHFSGQLWWSDETITGVLYLEYTNWPLNTTRWVPYNALNLDGTLDQALFLDANLAINAFRFRYERTAGTATLESAIIRKWK